ncbi:uncharacterized protein LOC124885672 [Capsicum annuum]|uniref:uncharacterized protein LOC124885672 n=1 Tax=Capsicum annuum TaxID=4072 RepID=UPI001FB15A51|nr:uncharacterized protein LOC124885672 [Capsicum annuum]
MCVVSDLHESIIKVVSVVYSNVLHLTYIWHLWKTDCTNFRKCKDRLSDIYYTMAKAYRKDEFDFFGNQVGKIDQRVKSYLGMLDLKSGHACMYLLENYLKSEIARIEKEHLMQSEIARIEKEHLMQTRHWDTIWLVHHQHMYFSIYNDGRKYIVCLDKRTCNYGRFQLDEITCEHAIVILKSKHVVDMNPYCSEFYYPETLRKTYEESMFSMPDKKDWIVPQEVMNEVVLPPKYKRPPGRPKKNRHKKSSETMTSSSNCYGRCGYAGHNRRTCNFFPKKN